MSHLARISATFSLISGIAIIIIWVIFYMIGLADDLIHAATVSFCLLFIAECLTSALLLIAGFGILQKKPWASKLFLLAMGMMLYAVIYASGQFFQKGYPLLGGFFLLIAFAAAAITIANVAAKNASVG